MAAALPAPADLHSSSRGDAGFCCYVRWVNQPSQPQKVVLQWEPGTVADLRQQLCNAVGEVAPVLRLWQDDVGAYVAACDDEHIPSRCSLKVAMQARQHNKENVSNIGDGTQPRAAVEGGASKRKYQAAGAQRKVPAGFRNERAAPAARDGQPHGATTERPPSVALRPKSPAGDDSGHQPTGRLPVGFGTSFFQKSLTVFDFPLQMLQTPTSLQSVLEQLE